MPTKLKKQAAPKKMHRILYVVLHGLIALIDVKKKGFIAHILDIGDDHKYLIGEWLQERDIPERKRGHDPLRLTLVNVKQGHAKLDTKLNAVIKVKSVPSDICSDVRATIRLPRPRRIYSFINGRLPKGAITGATGKLISPPTHLSGTQVFEYVFTPDKKRTVLVTEKGHVFQRLKAQAKPPKHPTIEVWALHIYDEPGQELPNPHDHNRKEFRMSSLFWDADLDLVKPTEDPGDINSIPLGLLDGELQNLDFRGLAVTPLVISARQGTVSEVGGGGAGGPVCGGTQAQL
jgi:hypothetical protein